MRLVTLDKGATTSAAVAIGDDYLDLAVARGIIPEARLAPDGVLGILQAQEPGLDLLRRIAEKAAQHKDTLRAAGALVSARNAKVAAPLPNPGMILAVGANYHEHLREMNAPAPATPMGFYKSVSSIVGPGGKIILPPDHGEMVDWEGEFTVVIGKPAHRVSAKDALDYVAGYTIINDVSARDWVEPAFTAAGMMATVVAWEHNILGKLYPTFAPIGPCIVTSDEIADPHNLKLETRLNGAVVQSANTNDLVFNVVQIIEYYSKFLTFRPGDMIMTGSPSGVGYGRKPQLFMKAGDTIEVEIEKIGVLSNTVAAHAD